jgi:anti-sigma factor RsiW
MEERIHELTAGYALDALDAEERGAYEAHLAGCGRCQEDLASFWEVTGSLAYAAAGSSPAPPPELRERLLERAQAERPNVVPLRRRGWRLPAATAAAAVAAVAALALGLWGTSLSGDLDDTRRALANERAAAQVLADPNARSVALSGADGRLVVSESGMAALVVNDLDDPPDGKAYEIWVIRDGRPEAAGLFVEGRLVPLDRPVPADATVAVTLEDEEGVTQPTGQPLFTASA